MFLIFFVFLGALRVVVRSSVAIQDTFRVSTDDPLTQFVLPALLALMIRPGLSTAPVAI